jgi:uncharacterized protein YceK
MKKLALIWCAAVILSGCASAQLRNDPDTILDDILVPLTMGLYRG